MQVNCCKRFPLLDTWKKHAADIIIGYYMPVMNGIELHARNVAVLYHHPTLFAAPAKFIVLNGYSDF